MPFKMSGWFFSYLIEIHGIFHPQSAMRIFQWWEFTRDDIRTLCHPNLCRLHNMHIMRWRENVWLFVAIGPKTKLKKLTIHQYVECLFPLNLWRNHTLTLTVGVSFSFSQIKPKTQPAQILVIYCIYWPYATHSASCVCVNSSVYEITFLRDRFILPHYLLTCHCKWGRASDRSNVTFVALKCLSMMIRWEWVLLQDRRTHQEKKSHGHQCELQQLKKTQSVNLTFMWCIVLRMREQ